MRFLKKIGYLFKSDEEIECETRREIARKGGLIGGKKKGKHNNPPKNEIVERWQAEHPDNFKMADCIRDTGLSKPTVYKYFRKH